MMQWSSDLRARRVLLFSFFGPRWIAGLLPGVVLLSACSTLPPPSASDLQCAGGWLRTELYFGLARPGGTVTAAEWQEFVDGEIAARFPEGFTVVDARGQWSSGGVPVREDSRIVVLLHRAGRGPETAVQALRETYRTRFAQDSVMRVSACTGVSF